MSPTGPNDPSIVKILQLIDFLDKGKQLGNPFLANKVRRALRGDFMPLYNYLQEHPEITERAKATIYIEGKLTEANPFYPPPNTKEQIERLSGELKLGYYSPFKHILGINPAGGNENVINVGRIRSGKSNLNLIVGEQILEIPREFNILIIDLKREYRCLLPKHPNLNVITFKNLRFNPLEVPEWQDPKDHINNIAEVFCKENYILAFGKNMFIEKLEYLYRERGIFDGTKNYPTFLDLYNVINAQSGPGRLNDAKATMLSRLKAYVDYPTIFCTRSFDFTTWLQHHLVIELENIPNEMYATITNLIVSLIYNYYHKKNLRGSRLRTLFIVDEAGILFNAQRDRNVQFGDSSINTFVRRGGEFGLGFWVTSQEPSTLSQAIHANTFLKFMFPLTEASQLQIMASSMALTNQQLLYAFKLPVGTCIVRYSNYPEPLLLDVPLYLDTDKKAVSDEFVLERMRAFYQKITPHYEPPVVETRTEKEPPPATISEDALTLLKHIAAHPFDNFTTHIKKCGLPKNSVQKARKWLEQNEFISAELIKTTKGRGRDSCYLVLETKALTQLNIKQHFGKGSFKHQIYCQLIKTCLESQGWKAQIEAATYPAKKLIDVLAEKDKETVGYEVTLHFENLQENIKKDLTDINTLFIVVEDKDVTKAQEAIEKCKQTIPPTKQLDVLSINTFFL